MRTKKSMINSVSGILSLIVTTLFAFIISRYFIINLGIEYNGLNGLFNNVIAILSITELGIAGSINFALYKPIYEKDYDKVAALMNFFKTAYRIIGIIILTLASIIMFFVPIFVKDGMFTDNYIRIVFMIFAINSSISYFFAYNRSLFFAYQDNYYVTAIDFIFKLSKTFLQLYILIAFKSYVWFLIVNVIMTVLNNFTIHILAKRKYQEIKIRHQELDKKSKQDVLTSVKSLGIIQIMSTSINFTDNLIISSLIGIKTAGLFVNYNMITTQLVAVIGTAFNGISASLGNLLAEDNRYRIKSVLYNLEYFGFFLASFCAVCLLFLIQPFVANIWLSKDYLLSFTLLILIVINVYLTVQRQTINYYLRVSGHFKDNVMPIVIEAIINLVISVVLALTIGLVGVIIGTVVSSIIGYILTANKYNKHIEQKNSHYWARQFTFLTITLIEVGFVKLITSIIILPNKILNFIFIGLICVVITGIVIMIIVIKNKNLDIFQKMLNHLLRRGKYEKNKN